MNSSYSQIASMVKAAISRQDQLHTPQHRHSTRAAGRFDLGSARARVEAYCNLDHTSLRSRRVSSSTSATSFSSTDRSPRTPPRSPTAPTGLASRRPFAKPRALALLQKDVDYTPLSPKKSSRSSSRYGTPLRSSTLGVGIPSTPSTPTSSRRPSEDTSAVVEACNADGTRSTEQKKEYLGTMLGNVEALVAGVRSAAVAFAA